MATRYRLEALGQEDKDFISGLGGGSKNVSMIGNTVYDELERGMIPAQIRKALGIPDTPQPGAMLQGSDWDIFLKSGSGKAYKNLQRILGALPSEIDAKKSYLKSNLSDTTNLTDEQLTEKQGLLTDLGKEKGALVKGRDRQIENMVVQLSNGMAKNLPSSRVDADVLRDIATYTIDHLGAGNYNWRDVAGSLRNLGVNGGEANKMAQFSIPKIYTTQTQSNEYEDRYLPSTDYSVDLKSVGDIIADRGTKRRLEKEYQDFASSAPGQLATEREAFFKGLPGFVI